jgi:hypothetical protein
LLDIKGVADEPDGRMLGGWDVDETVLARRWQNQLDTGACTDEIDGLMEGK